MRAKKAKLLRNIARNETIGLPWVKYAYERVPTIDGRDSGRIVLVDGGKAVYRALKNGL